MPTPIATNAPNESCERVLMRNMLAANSKILGQGEDAQELFAKMDWLTLDQNNKVSNPATVWQYPDYIEDVEMAAVPGGTWLFAVGGKYFDVGGKNSNEKDCFFLAKISESFIVTCKGF